MSNDHNTHFGLKNVSVLYVITPLKYQTVDGPRPNLKVKTEVVTQNRNETFRL